MKNLTDIKMKNNKIIIDGEIFYDFEDRYNNISSFGVEQQIQIFSQLINSISAANLPPSQGNELLLIYAYLFKVLSSKNAPSSVLVIGNNSFINIISEIVNLFSSENKLYYICNINNGYIHNCKNLVSIFVNEFHDINFLASNNFAVVLIDLDFIESNISAVITECNRILDRNGIILCYGSHILNSEIPVVSFSNATTFLYQLNQDRFLTSISIGSKSDDTSDNTKENVLKVIEQEGPKLLKNLQYIMSNRPASLDDIWYSIIDECIYIVNQIESIITEHYALFENEDLKFQTNEVKNALLDFKYEAYLNRKHYDFFQANLFDCYNDWVANIR